jgi:hypothetical protein
MDFIFTIPASPVSFVYNIANSTIGGGGSAGGTIYVYVNGVLQSTTVSSDLNAEIVNILWT